MGESRDNEGRREQYDPRLMSDSQLTAIAMQFAYNELTEEQNHHARQREAMRKAGEAFAQQRADVEKAFALLEQCLHEAKHGRHFADLVPQMEEVIVRYHNKACNGQGVTK